MSPTKNLSLVFKAVPQGLPVPGKDLVIEDHPIDLDNVPDGGLIVRNTYASLDPYLRLLLVAPATDSYRPPFSLDEPLRSLSIGEVIESSHAKFPKGTLIRTGLPIQQYTVLSAKDVQTRLEAPGSASIRAIPSSTSEIHPASWVGPLGMPGLTAYSSIFEIGRPQSRETIFVSSAAGAVGQIVGQICKIKGLKVIGSAGSAAKCEMILKDFGFDAAFNYKEESAIDALKRLAPDRLDIYYDNVGGQTLQDALSWMKTNGRIVICGQISQYNSTPSDKTGGGEPGLKGLFAFVSQALTMRGFTVNHPDFGPKYETQFEEDMQKWIVEGKMKPIMSEVQGIESGAEAFVSMLQGGNIGKALLKIWPDEKEGKASETKAGDVEWKLVS